MTYRLSTLLLMGAVGLSACGSGGPTPTQDTVAPTVGLSASPGTLTSPGDVTLTATASDNVGVTKVEFYDGTTLLSTDSTAPYTFIQLQTATSNGTHRYTARAYDAAGNSTASAEQNVTVNIASGPPAGVWDTAAWDTATFQ
ncbi:Ig-like domain-containing protein [Deinococcus hopiensis]|uniref:Chitinase n=1 Tax=Deinococcus hopiensis KR-140 TaxID=695939 RepID=A0A1W1USI5_9DEIO|nr:Ig-like domain-containing protein [Deinococcus hopiensis]SMB83781.1 chitinase [Deinococcus hopiensis KR-140]